jgi:hypothetical protein
MPDGVAGFLQVDARPERLIALLAVSLGFGDFSGIPMLHSVYIAPSPSTCLQKRLLGFQLP